MLTDNAKGKSDKLTHAPVETLYGYELPTIKMVI